MPIETGPHKHAVQQTFFLYVFEPGGHRIEVANAGARLILAPDWKTVTWSETERKKGQAWGATDHPDFSYERDAAAAGLGRRRWARVAGVDDLSGQGIAFLTTTMSGEMG